MKSEEVISKNRQASVETCRFLCKGYKKDILVQVLTGFELYIDQHSQHLLMLMLFIYLFFEISLSKDWSQKHHFAKMP